jgi:cell division protein FtsQ
VKLAVALASGLSGLAAGTLFGDALLARIAPQWARVRAIEVAGNVHTEPAAIAAASGLGANLPLADVDPESISRSLERLPWVRDARATTLTPNRVVVAIEERVPVAVARLADGRRFLVDATGAAFAPAPAGTQGPELLGLAALPAPGTPHPALAGATLLLAQWSAAGLPEASAVEVAQELGGELPAVRLAGRDLRVVVGGGEARAKLARLASILALNEPALTRVVEIDLRFPGQGVLRFAADCPPEPVPLGEVAPHEKASGAAAPLGGEEPCHAKTT